MKTFFQVLGAILAAVILIPLAFCVLVASNMPQQNEYKTYTYTLPVPDDEKAFLAAINNGYQQYQAGANEMPKGAARPALATAICQALRRNFHVTDWVGTISKLSSNSDGKGVLTIQISNGTYVPTNNNTFSDTLGGDIPTLIEPSSELFKTVSGLEVDQSVHFSGTFQGAHGYLAEHSSQPDCVKESSLTMQGAMTSPEFVMQFETVTVPAQRSESK
jgi:hypothetical protein